MSVNDYFLDATFNLEIPKTLDNVLKELSLTNLKTLIQSDVLLSIEEFSKNTEFMNSYNGLKSIYKLEESLKFSNMNIYDFLGAQFSSDHYFNDVELDISSISNDISIQLESNPSNNFNIEQLVPVIEKAVEKVLVKHEEKSQSPLDKFKRKNTATLILFILISYFTWLYGDDFKEANKKFIDKNIIHPLTDKVK